jgi:hypothetical protein
MQTDNNGPAAPTHPRRPPSLMILDFQGHTPNDLTPNYLGDGTD